MLVKPDLVSSLLLVVTIGVAFVLHGIISTLRILRSVESEFYLFPRLPVDPENHHRSHLQGHRTLIGLPNIPYFLLPDNAGIKLSRLHMQKEGWKGRWTHLDTSYLTVNPFRFTSFRERWMGCLSGSVFPTFSFH